MGSRRIMYRKRRQRRKKLLSAAIAVVLVAALGAGLFLNMGTESLAADKTYTADERTLDDWNNYLSTTTENIGRIWTDKSVSTEDVTLAGDSGIQINKGADSDFLVSLSALSTASSLTSTTTTPLDIVLVLDRSGSMGDNLTGGQTKLQALKNAVSNFLDQTATANAGASGDKQHRIGIVSYAYGATINQNLIACTSQNVNALKQTVNGFNANGSTYADDAMESAQTVLNNARSDAKKLVIFFTDGEPNHGNGFDNEVAADVVNTANAIKTAGAAIYTIGVFANADPSDTTEEFNQYMHAVSSNYPAATAEGSNGFLGWGARFTVTWGDGGSTDNGYYKAASDASELNGVFEDIFDSEVTGSGAPTQVTETEGFDATNSGYITFTDTLGDYVRFDDLNTVVYGNTEFTYDSKSENGDTTDYIFNSATVDSGIYNGDMKDLIVTVTKGQGSAGDVVTVQVPASLIPCRYFDVTTSEDGDMEVTVSKEAMPIRIFYDVSLDPAVDEQIMNGEIDSDLQAYIDGHKTDDGKVNFYSNKYESGEVGTTTARFTPGTGNAFYYFTADTPLYTRESTDSPATGQYSSSATYYYQITYYDTADNSQKTAWVSTTGLNAQYIRRGDGGQLYVQSGTKRISRTNDFVGSKTNNATGTASSYISPAWQPVGDEVVVSLGNNGRIQLALPGTLQVSKSVEAERGFTAPEGEEFTFTLNLQDGEGADLTDNYTAKIFDADNQEQQEEDYTVTDGSTFTLQDGWHIEVYGLPEGASYIVTETAKDHYTTTNDSGGGAANTAEGTIAAGATSSAAFTNTYGLDPITVNTANLFTADKVVDGRDWESTDEFTFRMEAGNEAAREVLTDAKTVTLSGQGTSYTDGQEVEIDYGDLTFSRPGEYWFALTEDVAASGGIPGITYSRAAYRVVVTVTDNNGTLEAVSAMYLLREEDGTQITTPEDHPVADEKAEFVNRFSADSIEAGPTGVKVYTDHSGAKPITVGMFQFEVEALEGAPLPPGTDDDGDQKIIVSNATATNNAAISFGTMEFTSDMVGETYKYKVIEVIPDAAVPGTEPNTEVLNGMTYDANTYYFVIEIDHETQNIPGEGQKEVVVPRFTYCTNPDDPTGTELKNQDGTAQGTLIFRNEYNVEPLILSGNAGLHGIKILEGRDMLAGEAFTFTVTGADQATRNAITNQIVTIQSSTANVSGGTDGTAEEFNFGDVTFTQPGTYRFNITESVPAQNPGGVTYDTHTAAVTVIVTDNNGRLEADSITYNNGTVSADTTQAVFVNTYAASGTLSGAANLAVTKDFTGRPGNAWLAGDIFTFEIAGYDDLTKQAITDGKITLTNTEVTANSYNQTVNFGDIRFTEPGTYQFAVTEQEGSLANVTYDGSTKIVTVTATDNGDGTLNVAVDSVTDAVTQTAAALTFENVYEPDEATLTGEGNLSITKRLTGREDDEWLDTDEFSFQMAAADDVTRQAFASGEIRFKDGGTTDEITIGADVEPDRNDRRTGSFGDMVFTKAGTYTFTISETTQTGTIPGVTCDDETGTITITVRDNGDGTLTPTVGYTGRRNFVNTYEASGTYELTGEKQISGRDFQAGDSFTFQVTGEDGAPMPNGVDADGKLTIQPASGKTADLNFGTIAFAQAGTYTYKVTEESKDADGVVSDTTEYTVVITATDEDDGTLSTEAAITGGEGNTIVFTNVYTPGAATLEGSTNLKVTKALTGRNWQDGDSFTFTLEGHGDDQATTDAIADGNILLPDNAAGITITNESDPKEASFGDITFTKAGTYVFNIKETAGNIGGITYDVQNHLVKVTVTDNLNGTMTASVTEGANPTITNTYAPGGTTQVTQADFGLKKVLEGKTWNGDEFGFTLAAVSGTEGGTAIAADDIPMPAETTVTVNKPDAADGKEATFGFGPIEYDTEGTYVYKVTENKGSNGGMSYDVHEATVTVTVSDNLNGGYTAAVSVEDGTFTNNYNNELDYVAAGGLDLIKNLTGHNLAAGQFAFTVTAADEASRDKAGFADMSKTIETTASAMADGVSSATMSVFDAMTFDTSDDGKTYTYTISETKKGGNGYTNDETEYTVEIRVDDNGSGELKATTTVTGGASTATYVYSNTAAGQQNRASVTFENRYEASGTAAINATKTLVNGTLRDQDFTFYVKDQNGGTVATAKNGADGTVDFGEISYNIAKLEADAKAGLAVKSADGSSGNYVYTYQYTVEEDISDLADNKGITPITASFSITVDVKDKGDGTLDVTVNYPAGSNGTLAFENQYGLGQEAVVRMDGVKVLAVESGDNAPDIAGKYTFTMRGSDGAPTPTNGWSVTNDAAGQVNFGTVRFTMDHLNGADLNAEGYRERIFTYTVTEQGSVDGVTNDQVQEKSFTIKVTDNGDGTLSAAAEPETTKFTFTNTYSVEPEESSPTDGTVTISKELTGRALQEGEFQFQMRDNGNNLVSEGSNKADGSVAFAPVTFLEPGTFEFRISEVKGDLGGVTYDGSEYKAVAQVTDNGDGTLSVDWTVTNGNNEEIDEITFKNTYKAAPTSVTLGASKRLDGRAVKAKEFAFELKDENGKVVSKASNDENGSVQFAALTYDQTGTYQYTISEVKGSDKTITYDDAVYTVTVEVTDDGNGTLKASVDNGGKEAVFTNVYTKPAEPVKGGETEGPTAVRTGDASHLLSTLLLMAAALVLIAAMSLLLIRRRRR